MEDTKITKLRNLMTPIINYFALLNKLNNDNLEVIEFNKTIKLLHKEGDNVKEVIDEVRAILSEIPNDACEEKPLFDNVNPNIIVEHYIGVDTSGDLNAYCLSRKQIGKRGMEVILVKTIKSDFDFDQEVKNMAKYFDAYLYDETLKKFVK